MASIASQPPPPPLEVRCVGCEETLEVEPGLTEFICPDCATPQSLPPELMPRKKKALPLPRGVDSNKVQLPCASCDVLLNVPHGLSKFVCPKCEVELAIDQGKLKKFLVGVSVAADAVEVIPSGVRFPQVENVEPRTLFSENAPSRTLVPSRVNAKEHTTPTPSQKQLPLSANVEKNNAVSSSSGAPVITPVNARKALLVEKDTKKYLKSLVCTSTPLTACTAVHSYLNAKQKNAPATSKTLASSSVHVEETEEGNRAFTPPQPTESIPGEHKKGRKRLADRTAILTPSSTEYMEHSVRRSKRLAKKSHIRACSSKQTDPKERQLGSSLSNKSQSGDSENTENQLEPQDIARQHNKSFPMDISQLLADSPQPHSETFMDSISEPQHGPDLEPFLDRNCEPSLDPHAHLDKSSAGHLNPGWVPHHHHFSSKDPHPEPISDLHEEPVLHPYQDQNSDDRFLAETVTDDEGDETYLPKAYSSESEPESVALRALQRLRKKSVGTGGVYRRTKASRGRGPNRCLEVWNRPDNAPIEVEFNDLGQPIGKESILLTQFLGIIAKDGELMPLNFSSWKLMPLEYKDNIWSIVKIKFKVQEVHWAYVMTAVQKLWSNWKSKLKKKHYDIHDNDEARLADISERVIPEQWSFLVHFWSSEKGQKLIAASKARRQKLKTMHTTGTKSFARIREEERMKRPDKKELSRADIFILTRTRKDGTTLDKESADIIARLREKLKNAGNAGETSNPQNDLLTEVLGKRDGEYIRTYGVVPNKSSLYSSRERTSNGAEKIVANARSPAAEDVELTKEKMKAMEKRHKDMEEEMSRMRKSMMAMQHLLSTQQQLSDQMDPVPPGFSGERTDGR